MALGSLLDFIDLVLRTVFLDSAIPLECVVCITVVLALAVRSSLPFLRSGPHQRAVSTALWSGCALADGVVFSFVLWLFAFCVFLVGFCLGLCFWAFCFVVGLCCLFFLAACFSDHRLQYTGIVWL